MDRFYVRTNTTLAQCQRKRHGNGKITRRYGVRVHVVSNSTVGVITDSLSVGLFVPGEGGSSEQYYITIQGIFDLCGIHYVISPPGWVFVQSRVRTSYVMINIVNITFTQRRRRRRTIDDPVGWSPPDKRGSRPNALSVKNHHTRLCTQHNTILLLLQYHTHTNGFDIIWRGGTNFHTRPSHTAGVPVLFLLSFLFCAIALFVY